MTSPKDGGAAQSWRDLPPDAVEWVRERPDSIKRLMLDFPPACWVVAAPGKSLCCPRPGDRAQIASYTEDGSVSVIGAARLPGEAEDLIKAFCDPSWLRVAEYELATPKDIAEILGYSSEEDARAALSERNRKP